MSPRPASPEEEAVLDLNSAVSGLYLSSLAGVRQEARRQGVSPRRMSSSTLSDGRSPVAAGVEGANRREKDAFSEVPPQAVCETAVVICARTARLWEENRFP